MSSILSVKEGKPTAKLSDRLMSVLGKGPDPGLRPLPSEVSVLFLGEKILGASSLSDSVIVVFFGESFPESLLTDGFSVVDVSGNPEIVGV